MLCKDNMTNHDFKTKKNIAKHIFLPFYTFFFFFFKKKKITKATEYGMYECYATQILEEKQRKKKEKKKKKNGHKE